MSQGSGEDPVREKKMDTFNNMISHLLKKRSSRSKPRSVSPKTGQWSNPCLPPPTKERSNAQLDDSPTPKRRKVAQSSPVKKSEAFGAPLHEPRPLDPPVLKIDDGSIRVSPTHKTVAFSDRVDEVDSSPTQRNMDSSPRHTTPSKPSKSILRNAEELEKPDSDLSRRSGSTSKLAGRDNASTQSSTGADPSSLDFWAGGEVHNLRDIDNVKEFKKLLEGGLKILSKNDSSSVARRFEVYATFNTIMPLLPPRNVSEVTAKKTAIIVRNLNTIVDICLPQLEAEQEKLLTADEKKDPFVSRLYIQIVRLFGSLLGNFRVLNAVAMDEVLKDKLKTVFDLSFDALTHANSNKAIITTQFALLADERYGPYFLHDKEVDKMIAAVLGAKEIASSNLICEKLLLIKSLITNHTAAMLKVVPLWLPREVLSRTFTEDDSTSLTILQTAISVLLLLLKKTIDSPVAQRDIVNCIRNSYAKDFLPDNFIAKNLSHGNLTLEELVQKQITYLIVKRNEYKLAMDFWLAMMGLLYNTTENLVELSKSDVHGWLKLNRVCFLSGQPPVKLIALKAWRIVTYCTWCHIEGETSSQDLTLVHLLERPFEFTAKYDSDPNVSEGLLYYLTGLFYTTCGTFESHKSEAFKFFWDELITPVYSKYIYKSKNILLRSKAINLLLRVIGSKVEGRFHKLEKKRSPAIKVISTAGTTLKDIQPVPTELIQGAYESVMRLVFGTIRSDLACWSTNYELFTSLVEQLPIELADQPHFNDFLQLALELSTAGKSPNTHDMFLRLCSTLTGSFGGLIFRDRTIFLKLIKAVDCLPGHIHDFKLRLLKELSRILKGKISDFRINERFLQIGDPPCRQYISNWIGSVLLSPDLSQADSKCLLNIVKILRSSEAIRNLLGFYSKSARDGNLFEQLNLSEWNDEEYVLFFHIFRANSINYLEANFKDELRRTLPNREEVFGQVASKLIELEDFSIIKDVITSNLKLTNALLPRYASFCPFILPVERLSDLMSILHTFGEDAQFTIIKWVLDSDKHEVLFAGDKAFLDTLFQPGPDGDLTERAKSAVGQIMERLHDAALWDFLSECIERCIKCHQEMFVTELFTQKGVESFRLLSSAAIATMAGRCGGLKSSIEEYLSKAFQDKRANFALRLTEDLLQLKKFQSLYNVKEEFLTFFIGDSCSFNESQLSKSRNIIKLLMKRLADNPDELVLPFVSCMLNIMGTDMTPNALGVIDFIGKHPKVEESVFKKSEEYNELLKKVQSHQTKKVALSQGGDTTGEEGIASCESHAGHFNAVSDGGKSLNKVEYSEAKSPGNKLHVQIPATQRVPNDTPCLGDGKPMIDSPAELPSSSIMDASLSPASKDLERSNSNAKKEGETAKNVIIDAQFGQKLSCEQKSCLGRKSPPETSNPTIEGVLNLKANGSFDNDISNISERSLGGKKKRYSARDRDDFADVQTDHDDELLKVLEKNLATKTSSVVKIKTSEHLEIDAADTLPAISETDDGDGGSKIRFPIFNFSKVGRTTSGNDVQVKKFTEDNIVRSIDTEEKVSGRPDKPVEELSRVEDIASQEATPSLRIHFPSKKVRRLVNRLRTFTLEDFSSVSLEEKRNLRIEMIGFLLNLEHDEESFRKNQA